MTARDNDDWALRVEDCRDEIVSAALAWGSAPSETTAGRLRDAVRNYRLFTNLPDRRKA